MRKGFGENGSHYAFWLLALYFWTWIEYTVLMNDTYMIASTLPEYSEEKLPCYVFDIDGTLADCKHRLHHIEGDKKDWQSFNSKCLLDAPIKTVGNILTTLSFNYTIILLTGRSEEFRRETERWLKIAGLEPDCLLMRKEDDYRKDYEMKSDYIDEIQSRFEILSVFDDNKDVLEMLRIRGIHTFDCSQTN